MKAYASPAAAASLLLFAHLAGAAPAADIIVGQSAEFSGQSIAKENTQGANVYFELINRAGGVHGRPVRLISLDDERKKDRTIRNTEQLITQDKAVALFGYRSTPSVEAVLPLLTKHQVPLVAPFTGAGTLRDPRHPYLFHLRASYREEAAKLVEHLTTLRVTRIAILHQDDAFGKDGLAGFVSQLKERRIEPLAVASYSRESLDVSTALQTIWAAKPDAVLMACTPKACVDFIKRARKLGIGPHLYTLSNVNSQEFLTGLGDAGRGVVISQVVPFPWDTGKPVIREFHQALKKVSNPPPITYATAEGYIAAKLLVDALRRAGPNPTPERLNTALQAGKPYDLGGLTVQGGPERTAGSGLVEITIVGRGGKILR